VGNARGSGRTPGEVGERQGKWENARGSDRGSWRLPATVALALTLCIPKTQYLEKSG